MDVGGKNCHRLSPIYYTSIAEIKGFRFKLEQTTSLQRNSQENAVSSPRPGQRRNYSALLPGANKPRYALTLPEARL